MDVGSACANAEIETQLSPDGEKKAVIFERDCGATTGFSTQVSILEARTSLPDESGNVFVADCDHGSAPPGRGGGPDVHMKWLKNDQLKIVYDRRARIFNRRQLYSGITVTYTVR
jgi:hypothetical protein